MSRRVCRLFAVAGLAMTACTGPPSGSFMLPSSQMDQYDTAYIAAVVADPDGDDLAEGAGEHVLIRSNFDHRTDMGGWTIEDADGNRLPLGIGRQLDPGAELRVHTACGDDSPEAVFACHDVEVFDDDGDVVRLLDAGDGEVARIAYGTAAE